MRLAILAGALWLGLAGSAAAQANADWNTHAANLRGRNGASFAFVCPSGPSSSGRLWGTDVYTDDSSICWAAAHVGAINANGGTVTIEIRPGASSYQGSVRNGVTSQSYGAWGGSFIVVSAIRNDGQTETVEMETEDEDVLARVGIANANWGTQADSLRGRNGQAFRFACPANGTISGRLWGTGTYTDDSSICTAAVHAGLISVANGGTVALRIKPGASSYRGTRRNGVTSQNYGAWSGSFVFLRAGNNTGGNVLQATWATQADTWRGRNGTQLRLRCPAGGTISGRLWGTDLYTDDSSICTAAVHAGLINTSGGGIVTIEIRAGAGSYRGSQRYGVTSQGYGGWSGSFVFIQ